MIRQVLKSRTVWLAILTAVLSVLQGFVFKLPVTPMEQAVVGSVLAALIVILRAVTTVPLSEK
jgi:hypothetical protein